MNQNILGYKKKSNFDDNLANVVNEIYDKMPEVVPENEDISKKDSKLGITDYTSFLVEEFADSYKLTNLMHYDELCSFVWDKELLDGGKGHTQDEWSKMTPKLPDVSVYFSSFLALYENKDGPQAELIEKIKQMFVKDFNEDFMMTSTRVIYKQNSVDEVIHDYGFSFHPLIRTNFVGNHGDIIHKGFDKIVGALFGTNDCEKVNKVFNWVTGMGVYLWRLSDKPSKDEEIPVFLGGSVKFGICANLAQSNSRPARGVIVIK